MDQPQRPITEPPPKPTSWQNAIASYMSRHVRHVRASSREWIRVHRGGSSRGGGGGGGNWLMILLVLGAIWLGVTIIQAIIEILRVILPWLIGLGVVAGIIWFILRRWTRPK